METGLLRRAYLWGTLVVCSLTRSSKKIPVSSGHQHQLPHWSNSRISLFWNLGCGTPFASGVKSYCGSYRREVFVRGKGKGRRAEGLKVSRREICQHLLYDIKGPF